MAQPYVILMGWTEQRIRNFKDTIRRVEEARSEVENLAKTSIYQIKRINQQVMIEKNISAIIFLR